MILKGRVEQCVFVCVWYRVFPAKTLLGVDKKRGKSTARVCECVRGRRIMLSGVDINSCGFLFFSKNEKVAKKRMRNMKEGERKRVC